MTQHLRPRRIWESIHAKSALSGDEKEHLNSCTLCMHVFKLSLLTEHPEDLEDGAPKAKAG